MSLPHPKLVNLLRQAYSAEKAAAFAYIGHARSVKDPGEKAAIRQIEADEWHHRKVVLAIMRQHAVSVSTYYELKYHVIGRCLSFSCYVIGWFMPFYFAGRLESGNVCGYFQMMHYFDDLGISDHHTVLYELGIKEKEHELYFLDRLQTHPLLPVFEKFFSWGKGTSFNDVDVEAEYDVAAARAYCRKRDS